MTLRSDLNGKAQGTIKGLKHDLDELLGEWGLVQVVAVLPIAAVLFLAETLMTEPLVDTWYTDTTVTKRLSWTRLAILGVAQAWTFATSGYGLVPGF